MSNHDERTKPQPTPPIKFGEINNASRADRITEVDRNAYRGPRPVAWAVATSLVLVQQMFDSLLYQSAELNMQDIQQIMNGLIAFNAAQREGIKEEKEDALEHKEKAEESEEKEREEFKEEARTKEGVEERLAKEIETRMSENEEDIKERIDNVIEVFEGTGLLFVAERVQENISEDRLDEAHERIEEVRKDLTEKEKVLESISERLKDAEKDGVGAGGLADSIVGLSKQDKGNLQTEIEGLSKDLNGLTKEEAVDRVKDFIDEHSRELNALKDIDGLLNNWDKMSQKEITESLKNLSEKIRETTETLRKDAEELNKLVSAPDEFIKRMKQLLAEDRDTLEAVRRTWIGAVIQFTKEKLAESDEKKDEKGKTFWKDVLEKIGGMRNKSLDEFNKRLAEILKGRPKDLQEARIRGDDAALSHIGRIIDDIERGRYSERLKDISKLSDKKEMRGPVERMANELRIVGKKAEAILDQAKKGNLAGIMDELGKPTGDIGAVGRVLIKSVDKNRNKAKKELIKQLTTELYAPMATKSIADGMKAVQEKGDYEQVDEMAAKVSENIGKLKGISAEMSVLLRMRESPQRRKMVARTLASAVMRGIQVKKEDKKLG